MLHVSDAIVDRHLSPTDALEAMRRAFASYGAGCGAMQERIRTEAGGVKLSTLGAVLPDQGFAGAKVYTTLAGRFSFVILLFSTADGRPLASFDAGAITRLRTAACSVLAAQHLARRDARVMALFGAGVQGLAHARQFCGSFSLDRILLCSSHASADLAQRLAQDCGVPVERCDAERAAARADIIVTASRSATPLFSGASLKSGAFIAAIGSSLPHTRELDDVALSRASAVVVEWRQQALREAGDIVLADPAALPPDKIVELADVVTGTVQPRRGDANIIVYKSVGVGLEDIALAGLAWERISRAAVLAPEER